MAKSPAKPGDEEKKIADADWLMGETSKAKPKPKTKSAPDRTQDETDHSYDLVEGPEEPAEAEIRPQPVSGFPDELAPAAPRKPKPKVQPEAEEEDTELEGEPAEVDQVWSRGAEWGGHLILLAGVAAGIAFLVYTVFYAVGLWPAFFLMLLGGAGLIVLCYPIFITLERPVRITPEQAAKDYYAMLSHMFPHYPRMWLLLSSAGRAAPEFSSLGEFKSYWKKKLAAFQRGKASSLNTLTFKVADFHSDKSAGQTALKAKYTLKVYQGEPTAANQVASYFISTTLVKGPDRMWYLNSGTLPAEKK